MTPEMEKLRAEIIKTDRNASGREGERFAAETFHKLDIPVEKVEQGISTLSQELKAAGAKRPDFIVHTDLDKSIILIDTKYHNTEKATAFKLKNEELKKYRALKKFTKEKFPGPEVFIYFMVYPKEFSGKQFAFVDLLAFDNATKDAINGEEASSVPIGKLLSSDTGEIVK